MLLKCVNTFVFLEGPLFSYDVLLHFVHLFARHSGGRLARDIRKDVFSIYGFGAGPGQSQVVRKSLLASWGQAAGSQVLEPSDSQDVGLEAGTRLNPKHSSLG